MKFFLKIVRQITQLSKFACTQCDRINTKIKHNCKSNYGFCCCLFLVIGVVFIRTFFYFSFSPFFNGVGGGVCFLRCFVVFEAYLSLPLNNCFALL